MVVSDIESESSEEEIIDEDFEDGLPICVQGNLTKLRRANKELKRQARILRRQFRRSQALAEELRIQVEDLNARVDRERRASGESENGEKLNCKKCKEFQLQLEELGERLGEANWNSSGLGQRQIGFSQTVEEEFKEAAWKWHYGTSSGSRRNSFKEGESIADAVKEAAEATLLTQGMVYEETSGLYYDYKSGYYFDAERSLYYDGHTGTYLEYEPESKSYVTHSTIPEEERQAQVTLRERARKEAKEKQELKAMMEAQKQPLHSALESISSVLDTQYSDESGDEDNCRQLPCMRLIVQETEDPKVTQGSLFIVTCKGGSVGSKGSHEVLLEDLGCSKNHAKISFQSENLKYFLKDLGSRNGTWVNGKRLSASKEESKLVEIGQGTVIQIGKSKLLCHVHPGLETCLGCEPGHVRATNSVETQEEREQREWEAVHGKKERSRNAVLKSLKRKYELSTEEIKNLKNSKSRYYDRAAERRKVIGSDNPHEKTQASSVDEAMKSDNKGFKMLEKMGWKGGGLGHEETGISVPIKVTQRAQGAGLGSEFQHLIVEKGFKKKAVKSDMWIKTQRRFEGAPVLGVFNQPDDEEENEDS